MSMTKNFTHFYGLQNTNLKIPKIFSDFQMTMRMCVLRFSHFLQLLQMWLIESECISHHNITNIKNIKNITNNKL